MYDIDAFTPIINLPEAGHPGRGAHPAQAGRPRAARSWSRQMWTLSLAFDHRLVDGAPAARFLQRIKQLGARIPILACIGGAGLVAHDRQKGTGETQNMQTEIAILGGWPGWLRSRHSRSPTWRASVVTHRRARVGGVCLNVGCIPTKALLRSAEVLRSIQRQGLWAPTGRRCHPDWSAIQARKERVVKRLVGGVGLLLRKAEVQVIHGRGRLVGPKTLEVTRRWASACRRRHHRSPQAPARSYSRCRAWTFPASSIPPGRWRLEELPKRLLIIGGGVIGVEFADILRCLWRRGDHRRNAGPPAAPNGRRTGPDPGRGTRTSARCKLHLDSRVTRIDAVERGAAGLGRHRQGDVVSRPTRCWSPSVAAPTSRTSGLETAGVRVEKSGIPVNAHCRNQRARHLCHRRCDRRAQLAHVASRGRGGRGECPGPRGELDLKTNPGCVYTDPEIASVGLTEEAGARGGLRGSGGPLPAQRQWQGPDLRRAHRLCQGRQRSAVRRGAGPAHRCAPRQRPDPRRSAGPGPRSHPGRVVATIHGHPTLAEAVREAMLELRDGASAPPPLARTGAAPHRPARSN